MNRKRQGGGNDKAHSYIRMPINSCRRNDRIRKFGNPLTNNKLSQEMSVDANTCEWKFEEAITELQNTYWLPRGKDYLPVEKPAGHQLNVNIINNGTSWNHVPSPRTQWRGSRTTSEIPLPKKPNLNLITRKYPTNPNGSTTYKRTGLSSSKLSRSCQGTMLDWRRRDN